MPQIVVVRSSEGPASRYTVVHGHHRFEAARRCGRKSVAALVINQVLTGEPLAELSRRLRQAGDSLLV